MGDRLCHNETGVPLPDREDAQMDDIGTKGWPVALERRAQQRIRLLQGAPSADFVSQLIAERDQLPLAGDNVGTAVGAYEAGGRITVRRMPAGYRRTVVA
jgi:hypothetical protein